MPSALRISERACIRFIVSVFVVCTQNRVAEKSARKRFTRPGEARPSRGVEEKEGDPEEREQQELIERGRRWPRGRARESSRSRG